MYLLLKNIGRICCNNLKENTVHLHIHSHTRFFIVQVGAILQYWCTKTVSQHQENFKYPQGSYYTSRSANIAPETKPLSIWIMGVIVELILFPSLFYQDEKRNIWVSGWLLTYFHQYNCLGMDKRSDVLTRLSVNVLRTPLTASTRLQTV